MGSQRLRGPSAPAGGSRGSFDSRGPRKARRDVRRREAAAYTTNRRGISRPRGLILGRPRAGAHGGPESAPRPTSGVGATLCVTPMQTCPRPEGFGRNLRSKTRWFTGFCNSHQVSHFATFFIDARAEISVAESRSVSIETTRRRPHAG